MRIANRLVGPGQPCFVIAEIGINHNGDLGVAKELIDVAVAAKCDAVKFQKRTVDVVYTTDELDKPRDSPFGSTNRDLKLALELGQKDYEEIDAYCAERGIVWLASCWDEASVDFIEAFHPPCFKIPSALLTHDDLLRHHRSYNRPILLSTGMSTMDQVRHAVEILGTDDLVLLHCTSTYPSRPEELNLKVIETLQSEFPCPVGYSGHEVGLQTSVAAVVTGACLVERHITLDRAMWGSDQSASVEPPGLYRLVRDIRTVELALGDGQKRVYDSEIPVMKKLRRVG